MCLAPRTATPWMGSFKLGDGTQRRTWRLDESGVNDARRGSESSQRLAQRRCLRSASRGCRQITQSKQPSTSCAVMCRGDQSGTEEEKSGVAVSVPSSLSEETGKEWGLGDGMKRLWSS